jgi:hypothetical protein
MTVPWSDERLEVVLRSVGEHLVVPEPSSGELAPVLGVITPKTGASWRRPLVTVAAVLVLMVAAAGVVVAPVREAVAGWLGIGSTRIERVGDDDATDGRGLPPLREGLVPARPAAAAQALGGDLPDLDLDHLGLPDLVALASEGGVIAAWEEGATTLWLRPTATEPIEVVKQGNHDLDVEPVEGLGDAALLVEGDHVLTTPDRRIAAGTVLLWADGDLELRLESELDPDTMVAIARSASLA